MFKQCAQIRNRAIVLAVAGALGVSGAALAITPAGAGVVRANPDRAAAPVATAQFSVLTKATTLNRGDVVKNAVALSKPVRVTVALKLRFSFNAAIAGFGREAFA